MPREEWVPPLLSLAFTGVDAVQASGLLDTSRTAIKFTVGAYCELLQAQLDLATAATPLQTGLIVNYCAVRS